jgi:hypothetical protein
MDISELEFNTITRLEYMKRVAAEEDGQIVIYYSNDNAIQENMLELGYLTRNGVDKLDEHIDHYEFLATTDKLNNASIDKILMDLIGYDANKFLKLKVVSIIDIPGNYEDLFNDLCEMNKSNDFTDIGSGDFRKALDMHGFTEGAGVNGHYSYGSDKLVDYCSKNLAKRTSHKPSPFRAESSGGQF